MTEKKIPMRIATFSFFIAALLFSGCLTPQQPDIPAWVESPPPATATELYGVSVADTPAQALVSAVGGIAAGVLSRAEPLLRRESSDPAMQARIRSEAKAILSNLDYSAVASKEQIALDKQTAVLVVMPRQAMNKNLAGALRHEADTLRKKINLSENAQTFARLGALGAANESLPRLIAAIVLRNAVDPAADTAAERQLATQIQNDYNRLKFGLGITVISDAQSIPFVNVLYKALRSQGILPEGRNIGTILVSSDSQQEFKNGRYRLTMRIRLKSTSEHTVIAQSEHFLKSSAASGYAEARKNAAGVLAKQIEKDGLFHTLGF